MDNYEYELETEEGYLKAYIVTNNKSSIKNLFSLDSENPLIDVVNLEIERFIYLEEVFIYPEFRRQGFAGILVKQFLEDVEEEEFPIILIAGSDQTPKTMDIVNFYENFGFEILFDHNERYVMIR